MNGVNESFLILKARKGCSDSFAKLFINRKEKFYKIAYCYLKNSDLALDAISEASYKGFLNIGKLKESDYFDTWLCKILINECLQMIRKNKRIVPLECQRLEFNAYTEDGIEERLDLHRALDKLSKDEKNILILKYFGDYTFSSISKMIDRSENTVKTKHYRAINKVRKLLMEEVG